MNWSGCGSCVDFQNALRSCCRRQGQLKQAHTHTVQRSIRDTIPMQILSIFTHFPLGFIVTKMYSSHPCQDVTKSSHINLHALKIEQHMPVPKTEIFIASQIPNKQSTSTALRQRSFERNIGSLLEFTSVCFKTSHCGEYETVLPFPHGHAVKHRCHQACSLGSQRRQPSQAKRRRC